MRTEGDETGITSSNITFYSNSGNMPGSVVCSSPTTTAAGSNSVEVTLSTPCSLSAGQYWVGMEFEMNFSPYGQLFLLLRSARSHNTAVWRNPPNGFNLGCANWTYINSCTLPNVDATFILYGDSQVDLQASAVCNGDNLAVTITNGDFPMTISGTGAGLPQTVNSAGTYTLNGPGAWTGVTVTETTGDGQSAVIGDIACSSPSSTLSASAACSGDNLIVSIPTGNAPFTLTGTGANLPFAATATGNHTLNGPSTWTSLTVTEDGADQQSIVLGDFSCITVALNVTAICNGDNLSIFVTDGDFPMTISGTGPNLPQTVNSAGTYTLNGPAAWTGVTVTENAGNGQSASFGNMACSSPASTLNVSAVCSGDELVVSILTGNAPFTLTGTGADLPYAAAATGTHNLVGPGNWTGLTVTEDGADQQSIVLGDFSCITVALNVTAICNGDNLSIFVTDGDFPMTISGTGPNLPQTVNSAGTYTLNGPAAWTGVTVTENAGNGQSASFGNMACSSPASTLNVSAVCSGDELVVSILTGNAPFTLTGTGADLPYAAAATGTHNLVGPGNWTGLTVTEDGADQESIVLGDFSCITVALDISAVCNGDNLNIIVNDGDFPINISGAGLGLPQTVNSAGTYTLNGPAAWTGVTATETAGNLQTTLLGDFACAAPSSSLNVSAVCSGDNLVVSILTGNEPFTISGTGTGLPYAAATTGIYTFNGPASWTGVTVTEDVLDNEVSVLGSFDCQAPIVLPPPGINVPNLGVVALYAHAPIRPYGAPNKERQSFALPHDSDGNGFDTYTVTASAELEGETWIALFNGTSAWLWVPYDAVQVIVPVSGLK